MKDTDILITTLFALYFQGAADILHFTRLLNIVMAADTQPACVGLYYDDHITPTVKLVANYQRDKFGLILGVPAGMPRVTPPKPELVD